MVLPSWSPLLFTSRAQFFLQIFFKHRGETAHFFLAKMMEKEALFKLFYESESSDKILGFTDTNLESD